MNNTIQQLLNDKINYLLFNEERAYSEENKLLLNDELKRKLSLTQISLADDFEEKMHPVAVISPQNIIINKNALIKFSKPEGDESNFDGFNRNMEFKNFISDLLLQAMSQDPVQKENTGKIISHKDYIDFIILKHPEKSDYINHLFFSKKQFRLVENYISTGEGLEKISDAKDIQEQEKTETERIRKNLSENTKSNPLNLLKGLIYLKELPKEIGMFLELYEKSNPKEEDFLITGLAAKNLSETHNFMDHVKLNSWLKIGSLKDLSIVDPEKFMKATLKNTYDNQITMRNELREKIAKYAFNLMHNSQDRKILISGITEYCYISSAFIDYNTTKNTIKNKKLNK